MPDLSQTNDQPPIRILLVDDHPIFTSGVSALLDDQPDMLVVGQAEDGLSACECAADLQPQIVVMDLVLPELDGVEATLRITSTHPNIKVLVLTGMNDPVRLQCALQAGASSVLLKQCAGTDLVRAIRSLAAGEPWIQALKMPDLPAENSPPLASASALSARESEVLRRLAAGHTAKDIAAQLGISVRTLETYRARAMDKLALKTRADIVRYGARQGWLLSS